MFYPQCYVPEFVARKQEISDRIRNFWRENLRELPYFKQLGRYTLDVVLSPDLCTLRVIEVNNPVCVRAYN